LLKRAGTDPVDNAYLLFVDLHSSDQRPNDLATRRPVGRLDVVVDAVRKFLDATDDQLEFFLFRFLLG